MYAGPPVPRAAQRPGFFFSLAVTALRSLPGQTATSSQICRAVTENSALSAKLLPSDWLVEMGKKIRQGLYVIVQGMLGQKEKKSHVRIRTA
jgi:hypothetical protein